MMVSEMASLIRNLRTGVSILRVTLFVGLHPIDDDFLRVVAVKAEPSLNVSAGSEHIRLAGLAYSLVGNELLSGDRCATFRL